MSIAVSGGYRNDSFEPSLRKLVSSNFASRLFAQDSTLWGQEAETEAAIRLGWTDFSTNAQKVLSAAQRLHTDFVAAGIDRIVLCGMGGSSLAPFVMSERLVVLDSTHPDAVRSVMSGGLETTAVVVSSKSGGTIETLSHRATFETAFAAEGIDPASRIVVVTDPGSALERSANNAGQKVFLADPNVGGRFSALTAYGIVPSVLSGADIAEVIAAAAAVRGLLMQDTTDNPALVLAATIASALPQRLVLEVTSSDERLQHLGLWIEQIIAESTGKNGKGVYPIAVSSPFAETDHDLLSVQRVSLGSELIEDAAAEAKIYVSGSLGSQFLLWEVTTAALGFLLEIDPFNQPDVEAAKIAARELFVSPDGITTSAETLSASDVLTQLRAAVEPEGYIAVQAFTSSMDPVLTERLNALQTALTAGLGLPVSMGLGPRYLHSTGQFHKGGPAVGVFLQLIELATQDLAIPQSSSTFGDLILAQAAGDAAVLRERGRPVVTVVSSNALSFIDELIAECTAMQD